MDHIIDHLSGPNGGVNALCFIAGFAGAYSYAMRTIVAEARKRIDRLETKVDELQRELLMEARSHDRS
ncbi:hypothetical protein [Shimia ponticola]|uniref:hypothetical protein n=1 Tax=Shimia ponticola TaxID=2582893 RepID=UPI0011BE60A8|nr:hypothetical protein [Shimia ponticola]